ncbi:c-type cytochrome [Martelella endophytica]|uniref:Cytochrome C556 n=1 Tax=Martelella endophytica TaxID=1486262 RepID=A0A0D5LUH6_MAREN|nr:cytochrome c [Martelella endophytica]AJY47402.1 cytochrome C556 [Martelella endophytica]
MKNRYLIAGVVALCLGAGAVVAEDAPQILRQDDMKGIGRAMGQLGAIAKGENAYDPVVVEGALSTISANAKDFPTHFPPGSETGLDTEASPKIWENMDDFTAHSEKLASAADALLADLPADQAAVGAAVKSLGSNCGTCHQLYRVKN